MEHLTILEKLPHILTLWVLLTIAFFLLLFFLLALARKLAI